MPILPKMWVKLRPLRGRVNSPRRVAMSLQQQKDAGVSRDTIRIVRTVVLVAGFLVTAFLYGCASAPKSSQKTSGLDSCSPLLPFRDTVFPKSLDMTRQAAMSALVRHGYTITNLETFHISGTKDIKDEKELTIDERRGLLEMRTIPGNWVVSRRSQICMEPLDQSSTKVRVIDHVGEILTEMTKALVP